MVESCSIKKKHLYQVYDKVLILPWILNIWGGGVKMVTTSFSFWWEIYNLLPREKGIIISFESTTFLRADVKQKEMVNKSQLHDHRYKVNTAEKSILNLTLHTILIVTLHFSLWSHFHNWWYERLNSKITAARCSYFVLKSISQEWPRDDKHWN